MTDLVKSLEELTAKREMLIDEIARRDGDLDSLDRINWIRRNVGRGAPGSWEINDFMALVIVKLGQAAINLNPERPDWPPSKRLSTRERREGCENLLAAAMVLVDAAERYRA